MQRQIKNLVDWVAKYNTHTLQNEDDVETKFVLPLFQILGYPENCRRGKYPLRTYTPGGKKRRGRKPEIDQAFFSEDEPKKQNPDSCLVIVEAKDPKKSNLDEDVAQARFYSYHLTPIFLVITNGNRLIVLKRHRFRQEETIFDGDIREMTDDTKAREFYNHLNFELVKRLKAQVANIITHKKYVELDQALYRYPDLRAILAKGDFTPTKIVEGRRLTIVRPKVAITCDLPYAFDRGKFTVEFSNITLRSLIVEVGHKDILGKFMKGLDTPPHHGTRRFIKKLEKGIFEVYLGSTTVTLSEEEAIYLCVCVDTVCSQYKQVIMTAERHLEVQNLLLFTDNDDDLGHLKFYLCSIKPELWELMNKFATEFDYDNGSSDWHIFEGRSHSWLRVSGKKGHLIPNHANIAGIKRSDLSDDYIHLLFCVPKWHLEFVDKIMGSWQQTIGPRGIWTGRYTKDWLLNKFIPKVRDYYNQHQPVYYEIYQAAPTDFRTDFIPIDETSEMIPIADIDHPSQLREYIDRGIQPWLMHYRANVSTKILKPFFEAFVDFVRQTDGSNVNINYIQEKIAGIDISKPNEIFGTGSKQQWSFVDVIQRFDNQIEKMNYVKYINNFHAELMLRAFGAILDGKIENFTQAQLNRVKQTLQPLWELSEFERRYVIPQWGWDGLSYKE